MGYYQALPEVRSRVLMMDDEDFRAELERINAYYDAERERINREAAWHLKAYAIGVALVAIGLLVFDLYLLYG